MIGLHSHERTAQLTLLLTVITLGLLLANACAVFIRITLDHDSVMGLIPLFDFNNEGNAPTLYSLTLRVCSFLLLVSFLAHRPIRNQAPLFWVGLCGFVFLLMLDELLGVHDIATYLIESVFTKLGWQTLVNLFPRGYHWVIIFFVVYGLCVIALAILYRVSGDIRASLLGKKLVLLSVLFMLGNLGFELFGGYHAARHGMDGYFYAVLYSFEKALEIVSFNLFIVVLLKYRVCHFE